MKHKFIKSTVIAIAAAITFGVGNASAIDIKNIIAHANKTNNTSGLKTSTQTKGSAPVVLKKSKTQLMVTTFKQLGYHTTTNYEYAINPTTGLKTKINVITAQANDGRYMKAAVVPEGIPTPDAGPGARGPYAMGKGVSLYTDATGDALKMHRDKNILGKIYKNNEEKLKIDQMFMTQPIKPLNQKRSYMGLDLSSK